MTVSVQFLVCCRHLGALPPVLFQSELRWFRHACRRLVEETTREVTTSEPCCRRIALPQPTGHLRPQTLTLDGENGHLDTGPPSLGRAVEDAVVAMDIGATALR